MPDAPYDFAISFTDFHIIFINYGNPIPGKDAAACIHITLAETEREIYTHWTQKDIPIDQNLVTASGRAKLTVYAAPLMYRTYCLMLILGLLEWGQINGFIEVDMKFMKYTGTQRTTLGFGTFRLLGPAS